MGKRVSNKKKNCRIPNKNKNKKNLTAMNQRNETINDEVKFESYELAILKYLEGARKFHENAAAVKIQASVRGMLGRFDYMDMKYAAIAIQAGIRGHVTRKVVRREAEVIMKIQSGIRRYFARRTFTKIRMAVLKLQMITRNMIENI